METASEGIAEVTEGAAVEIVEESPKDAIAESQVLVEAAGARTIVETKNDDEELALEIYRRPAGAVALVIEVNSGDDKEPSVEKNAKSKTEVELQPQPTTGSGSSEPPRGGGRPPGGGKGLTGGGEHGSENSEPNENGGERKAEVPKENTEAVKAEATLVASEQAPPDLIHEELSNLLLRQTTGEDFPHWEAEVEGARVEVKSLSNMSLAIREMDNDDELTPYSHDAEVQAGKGHLRVTIHCAPEEKDSRGFPVERYEYDIFKPEDLVPADHPEIAARLLDTASEEVASALAVDAENSDIARTTSLKDLSSMTSDALRLAVPLDVPITTVTEVVKRPTGDESETRIVQDLPSYERHHDLIKAVLERAEAEAPTIVPLEISSERGTESHARELTQPVITAESVLERIDALGEHVSFEEKLEVLRAELGQVIGDPILFRTMEQMSADMYSHLADYGRIIGDDTAGRIPALLCRELINRARAEAGLPPVEIRFIYSGGTQSLASRVPPAKERDQRTLVVTEEIGHGETMTHLYMEAHEMGDSAGVDIAAVTASQYGFEVMDDLATSFDPDTRFFMGEVGQQIGVRTITTMTAWVGVTKEPQAPFASPLPKNIRIGSRASMKEVRQKIKLMGEVLYKLLGDREP